MFVSKVVIILLSPRGQNNDVMFNPVGLFTQCDPTTVAPTPANWVCNENNQLTWEGTPVRIPPYSVFPFQALVHPDKLAGADQLSSVIVHGNVFTTFGQFGKAGYSTSFDNISGSSIAGVFLAKNPNSVSINDMISNQTGIVSGSVVSFNTTLADYEPGTHFIDDSSRLIINVPKGWVVDEPSITSSFFTTSYQSFGDTSSQIIETLDSDLTSGGVSIQFNPGIFSHN